jgi:hypothetical protein
MRPWWWGVGMRRFWRSIARSSRSSLCASLLQQALDNRESPARQYALQDYAVALGWPTTRVLIITAALTARCNTRGAT